MPPERELVQERPDSDPTDRTGQVLGDFQLLRRLGEGGMGQVYLAEQLSLKRRVALKLLKSELAASEVSRKRFQAEAKAVAQLTHPNIVQVYAAGTENGLPYIALEYVDGRNLRDYVARKGPPPLPFALTVIWQTASALQRAAELGIIHRDIKPENILLTRKHEVKVADFGLSRMIAEGQPAIHLTQTGVTMGTPLYMSPEQVEGRRLDPRTDIYSLGVTCYHMFTGRPPFEGENAFAVALQHVQATPIPLETIRPDLPLELCQMVMRMMAKKPEDRYQTTGEILHDLKLFGELHQGVSSESSAVLSTLTLAQPAVSSEAMPALSTSTMPMPLPHTRFSQWVRGLAWITAVVGSVGLAATLGAGLGWSLRAQPEELAPESLDSASKSAALDAMLGSYKRKERGYLDLIRETENPGRERDELRRGIQHRMDLGLLYLEQEPRELEKAFELFTRQSQSKVREYEAVGKLGLAMVHAFQDDPAKSNALFKEVVVQNLPRLPSGPPNHRWIRAMLVSMQHNARNQEVLSGPASKAPPEAEQLERYLRSQMPPSGSPPGTGAK